MIRIGLFSRLLPIVTALAFVVVAQVARGQDDEAEEKVHAQELRQRELDKANTARLKLQFDQLVFGNGGWRAGAQREFENRLAEQVDQFDRICELSESQKKKLLAAGRGDIKRFTDRLEEARRRLPEVHGNFLAHGLNVARQEAGLLKKEREAILAGEGFFFRQALRHTLTEAQLGRYRKDIEDRRAYRHRAAVRWTVVMLARSLGLTDDQRRRFEAVLLEETRPPREDEFGGADYPILMYEVVMDQAAKIPEAKIKPIFDDLQWRVLSREFAVARDQGAGLKIRGHLPPLRGN